jgi:SAM-dependent methyltransferase
MMGRMSQVARRSSIVDHAVLRMRWGSRRRLTPETAWGHERGLPVDRWYIEQFLNQQRHHVHGRVLEVKEDLYASSLGADQVDVLDIDARNPHATIVGDLCDPATLPTDSFDAAVVTQTLQLVAQPALAVQLLLRSLTPNGHLLLTVPCVSRVAGDSDRWRWTAAGLRQMIADAGVTDPEITERGNNASCRAFLCGLGVADLSATVLRKDDPSYPLLVTAVVRRA